MNILPKFVNLLHATIFMATLLVATALYKEKMSIGEGIISIILLLLLVCVSRLNAVFDTHTKVSIPSNQIKLSVLPKNDVDVEYKSW